MTKMVQRILVFILAAFIVVPTNCNALPDLPAQSNSESLADVHSLSDFLSEEESVPSKPSENIYDIAKRYNIDLDALTVAPIGDMVIDETPRDTIRLELLVNGSLVRFRKGHTIIASETGSIESYYIDFQSDAAFVMDYNMDRHLMAYRATDTELSIYLIDECHGETLSICITLEDCDITYDTDYKEGEIVDTLKTSDQFFYMKKQTGSPQNGYGVPDASLGTRYYLASVGSPIQQQLPRVSTSSGYFVFDTQPVMHVSPSGYLLLTGLQNGVETTINAQLSNEDLRFSVWQDETYLLGKLVVARGDSYTYYAPGGKNQLLMQDGNLGKGVYNYSHKIVEQNGEEVDESGEYGYTHARDLAYEVEYNEDFIPVRVKAGGHTFSYDHSYISNDAQSDGITLPKDARAFLGEIKAYSSETILMTNLSHSLPEAELKPGDTILGFTLGELRNETYSYRIRKQHPRNVQAILDGSVTLTGTLTIFFSEYYGGYTADFIVAESSQGKVPIPLSFMPEVGSPYYRFQLSKGNELGYEQRGVWENAVITVDQIGWIYRAESEGFIGMRLVSINTMGNRVNHKDNPIFMNEDEWPQQ